MTPSISRRAGAAMGWQAAQFACTQAIYFLRLLILARLLAPDDFGLLAIATVALGVLLGLSELGMVSAVVQRPEVTEDHYDVAWTVGVLRGAAVAGCLALAAPGVARLFGEPGAAPIVAALALRPAIEALASIEIARLTKELRFRELSAIRVPPAVVDIAVAVVLAPRFGVWALVAGAIAHAVATVILSYAVTPRRPRFLLRAEAAAGLLRYGRWVLLSGVVGLAASSTSQAVISSVLGAAGLGVYFLAYKVAFFPSNVAGAVVGTVAFPLYAQDPKGESGANVFRALLTGQAVVVLPAYALVITLAPELESVLGPRWAGTAPVIRILAATSAIGLFGESVLPLLMGRGRPNQVLVIESVQSGVWLAGLWPLVHGLGVPGAAVAWLLGASAGQVIAYAYLRRAAARPLRGLAARLGAVTVASIGGGGAAALVVTAFGGVGGLVVSALTGGGAALLLLHGLDRRFDLGMMRALRQRGATPDGAPAEATDSIRAIGP
ncbi:MAG: oligosaccharide flippase family protein [Deferrisomatales bacterium]|nr:oligosaccharide flippase family protein [Deferrisomatales bacterium]